MLKVKIRKIFQKDLDTLLKNGFDTSTLDEVIDKIRNKEILEPKYKDHALKGNLKDYRDCHIKSDLVLIYRVDGEFLELVALDNHNNVFKKISKF